VRVCYYRTYLAGVMVFFLWFGSALILVTCLTAVRVSVVAYGQNPEAPGKILDLCSRGRFCKR